MIAWLEKLLALLAAYRAGRKAQASADRDAELRTLEAERKAAAEAPSSREETAKKLGEDGF